MSSTTYRGTVENVTKVRLTASTLAVLSVLSTATADNPAYGIQIMNLTNLGSGTVYPILARLARAGWVDVWDEPASLMPRDVGRPARRLYTLSPQGRSNLENALADKPARRRYFPTSSKEN